VGEVGDSEYWPQMNTDKKRRGSRRLLDPRIRVLDSPGSRSNARLKLVNVQRGRGVRQRDGALVALSELPLVEGVGDRSLSGMRIRARRPAPTRAANDLGSLITRSWNHLMEWLERLESLRECVRPLLNLQP
jgi:hypothetical protein